MSSKRRIFTPEFKLECVLDVLSCRKSPARICRERNLSESLLTRWWQQFVDRAPKIFEIDSQQASAEAQRMRELERLVGRLTLELEASKNSPATSPFGSPEEGVGPSSGQ